MVDLTPAVTGVAIGLGVCIVALIIVLIFFFTGRQPLIDGYASPTSMEQDQYRFTGNAYNSNNQQVALPMRRQQPWGGMFGGMPQSSGPAYRSRMYLPDSNQVYSSALPALPGPPVQRMAEVSSNQRYGWTPTVAPDNNIHIADVHQTPRGTTVTMAGDDYGLPMSRYGMGGGACNVCPTDGAMGQTSFYR